MKPQTEHTAPILDLDDHQALIMVEEDTVTSSKYLGEFNGWPHSKAKRILNKLRDHGLVRHVNKGQEQWWELTPIAEAVWAVAALHFEEVYRDA